jgi:RNA polymerase II C-terminal domain phosphatase-like 1/2
MLLWVYEIIYDCIVTCYVYREFDEILIRRMSEVFYEDEVKSLPPPPDVINYMMAEVFVLRY